MNVGTAHSEVNPNTRVMNSRGIWLSYVLAIGLLHVVLLSIPFVSVPVVWTLTNLIHNLVRACLLRSSPHVGHSVPELRVTGQTPQVLSASVTRAQDQLVSLPCSPLWAVACLQE